MVKLFVDVLESCRGIINNGPNLAHIARGSLSGYVLHEPNDPLQLLLKLLKRAWAR